MARLSDRRFNIDDFSRISRRGLLGGLAGSALVIGGDALWSRISAAPIFSKYPFALGVASGDPTASGVVLWTRIVPEPYHPNGGMPNQAVEVGWEVASDRSFRTIVKKGTEIAYPELAHSVHVEVDGLEPAREYFYRFTVGSERSMAGRTKTLPAAGSTQEVRFGVGGCQRYEHAFFTAYDEIAADNLDFFFLYGDFIYESRSVLKIADPSHIAREMPIALQECFSLADYRLRYAVYRSDAKLMGAHRTTPFIPIFDDHEVSNDWMSDVHYYGHPNEVFLLRRAAAFQAWYEHQPVRKALLPRAGSMTAYRSFDIGALMRFNVLDTRQFRDGRFCKGKLTSACAPDASAEGQMLGSTQEAWLLNSLKSSSAQWNVMGQQILFSQSHLIPKADKWDRAPVARQRLVDAMADGKIANPVVLSGDLHFAVGADIKKNFNDPNSPTIGTEILNLAIASNPPSDATQPFFDKVKTESAHVKYLSRERGWVRHTVNASTWRADVRAIDNPMVENSPMKQAATLSIAAGKPGLQVG